MNAIWTVFLKELTDAFRDRRMVLVAFVIMPLVFPAIFAGMGAIGAKKVTEKLESTLKLPVVGQENAPNLVRWLATQNLEIVDAPADVDAAIRAQEHDVILRIDGTDMNDLEDLMILINKHKVGDTLKLTILREDQELEVEVVLGVRS